MYLVFLSEHRSKFLVQKYHIDSEAQNLPLDIAAVANESKRQAANLPRLPPRPTSGS